MKGFRNASNLSTIKLNNRSLILRILNTLGSVSRAELSRLTGLTKTSITNIINELLESGIIYETGTIDSQSGRKPIILNLSENALYSIGVYISRDYAYTNIVNLKGSIISEKTHAFELTESLNSLLSGICSSIREVLLQSKIELSKVLGIGVASIGPLDIRNGIILNPPNFRGLKSVPIVEALEKEFDLNTYIDNDMNASAIAEKLFGSAKNNSNFIYVGVTNGIGSGIYLNNSIFRGSNGFAGEIGHTTIDVNGEQCPCGNFGCLELYAGIPHAVKQVKTSIELGSESSLTKENKITWESIVNAASCGDSLCLKVMERLAYYLSIGIVNAINTFDPEIVFIGHDIAIAGDLIVKSLNEMINRSLFLRTSGKPIHVELSGFGDYAPRIGAPSIVLDRFFNGGII